MGTRTLFSHRLDARDNVSVGALDLFRKRSEGRQRIGIRSAIQSLNGLIEGSLKGLVASTVGAAIAPRWYSFIETGQSVAEQLLKGVQVLDQLVTAVGPTAAIPSSKSVRS